MNGDQVIEHLRTDILVGEFLPGERLTEARLTKRYGVGRGAVRQALQLLEREHLVVREANRGATVRKISIEEAIQITEARQELESLAARHAARNATDDDKAELREIGDAMRTAVAERRFGDYAELNRRLHLAIREMSEHLVADQLIGNLRDRSARHQFRLAQQAGRPQVSLGQHERIIDAIVAGDEHAAANAMRSHLADVVAVLRAWEQPTAVGRDLA